MIIDNLDNCNNKYSIIYADPPWKYDFALNKNDLVNNKYSVMTKEQICNLPIKNICAENCVLFMWVTFPKLNWAFSVINAWGFEYKTCAFTWIKLNKNNDKLFLGMGHYTRSNAEICLLAIKGKSHKRLSHNVQQVLMSKLEGHSKKPDIVRENIVKLFGDLPRIELFARQQVDGWDCFGNEIKETPAQNNIR